MQCRTLKFLFLGCCLASIPWRSDAQTQLDATWTVTVNGQAVAVNPDGSFLIPNIAAADNFGPDGPGTAPDFVADEFLRLVGTSMAGGRTRWVASEFFQVSAGESYVVSKLTFGDRPPVVPASLRLEVERLVIALGDTVALRVTAVLGDQSEVDVTPRGAFTIYAASRPGVEIDDGGRLTATSAGPVVITARNSGAVAARRIDVVAETTPTTLEGFCELADGTPAAGADVEASTGARGTADARGFFSLKVAVARGKPLEVLARRDLAGVLHSAMSGPLEVWAGGVTDAGVLVLRAPSRWLFGNPQFTSGVADLREIAAGDLDQDGLLDVVVAGGLGAAETVSVMRGDQSGLLAQTYQVGFSQGVTALALADLERDGDLDVLAGYGSMGFVERLVNDGTGSLAPLGGIPAGRMPSSAAVGDVDGDGETDLCVADLEEGVIRVFRGGDGAEFATAEVHAAGTRAGARLADLVLADLDGDLALDIAAVDDTALSLLFNRGDGGFAPRTVRAVPCRPLALAADDLDGDGDADLAVGGTRTILDPATLALLFNSGGGSFLVERTFNLSITPEVATGDLEGDGLLDLVVSEGQVENALVILRGSGAGEFSVEGRLGASDSPQAGLLRDLDGDALVDIVHGDHVGQVSVFPNLGGGRFESYSPHPAGSNPVALLAADLDADGDEDLVTANEFGPSALSLLLNAGDGSFAAHAGVGSNLAANDAAVADLDGDGDLDLACVMSNREARIALNDGAASFTLAPPIMAGDLPHGVALGDLDGDGLADLALVNAFGNDVWVYANEGQATFGAPVRFPIGNRPRRVLPADIDLDGDLDLLVIIELRVAFLGNLGDGDFMAAGGHAPLPPTSVGEMAWGADADGDGVADLALSLHREGVELVHGNGDGTFGRARRLRGEAAGIALGDLDRDGFTDVLSTSSNRGYLAFRAGSAAMFLEERLFGAGAEPGRLVIRDLDRDGRPDVAVANRTMGVSVLLQSR